MGEAAEGGVLYAYRSQGSLGERDGSTDEEAGSSMSRHGSGHEEWHHSLITKHIGKQRIRCGCIKSEHDDPLPVLLFPCYRTLCGDRQKHS